MDNDDRTSECTAAKVSHLSLQALALNLPFRMPGSGAPAVA